MNTQRYFQDCVKSIGEIIKFDSSQAPALPGMPFGKGAADSLAYFLNLAKSMGFAVHNYDNYAGEVLFGEGEEFAILCHLDVVPAGTGWTYPPFEGVIENGRLYGRGTMDDKGPAIICLYCLKALKDAGFLPKKKIKLIVGCNEENGWECIAHYNRCAHMPENGFSPDADFPVIWAEKGILQFSAEFPLQNAPFTALYGGERANMVCELVCVEGAACDAALAEQCGVRVENGKLAARGISAHASTPEQGDNALKKMLRFFAAQNKQIAKIYDIFFADSLGLCALFDETGALTMSPNVANFSDGVLTITTDIRYPATFSQERILQILDKGGFSYKLLHCQKPLYNDRNGFLISTLRKVYAACTGKEAEPIAIGGGTYARALKNGAGFGPQFPDEPSTIHQKDEYISLSNVQKLLDIYCAAIEALTGETKN